MQSQQQVKDPERTADEVGGVCAQVVLPRGKRSRKDADGDEEMEDAEEEEDDDANEGEEGENTDPNAARLGPLDFSGLKRHLTAKTGLSSHPLVLWPVWPSRYRGKQQYI